MSFATVQVIQAWFLWIYRLDRTMWWVPATVWLSTCGVATPSD
jgi:hypothetical protein